MPIKKAVKTKKPIKKTITPISKEEKVAGAPAVEIIADE